MQIFRELAGYSLGRADIVRRAMSKKKHDVLERERQVFIRGQQEPDGSWAVEGCVNRGVEENTAAELFREIESFASYAFNKSHAAAYAVVAYQTAYLKAHYPKEYMAALLSSVQGWTGKTAEYIEECRRLKIQVLPPHVNESGKGFTVVEKGIRFGLGAVKNLGDGVILRMEEERRAEGPFTSFQNFCKRMTGRELNRRAIESLIKSGALDNLGYNRREMLLNLDGVLDALEADKRRNLDGQLGFFDGPETAEAGETPLHRLEDFSVADRLSQEREVTGMYLSGHPMDSYAELYRTGAYARTDEILRSGEGESREYRDGQRVTLLAMVEEIRQKTTKNGGVMAFVTLEDMYGSITGLVFARVLEEYRPLLVEGAAVEAAGRLSFTEDKEPELVCERFAKPGQAAPRAPAMEPPQKPRGREGLFLRVDSPDSPAYRKALEYLAVFDEGTEELYVRFRDTGELRKAPTGRRIEVNRPLLSALERLLGVENVAYRGRNL